MQNLHHLFKKFEQEIKITNTRIIEMRTSRDNLQSKIKKYFAEHFTDYTPRFWIQGSFKMGTMVRNANDHTDIDVGVYFSSNLDNLSPSHLQEHVIAAIANTTQHQITHKNKCVTVHYSHNYSIDFPVYLKSNGEVPKLAHKNNHWIEDDPKEMYDAFLSFKKQLDGKNASGEQMRRIVKYLKAWSDNVRECMPSGISWTILVLQNFQSCTGRDDQSLYYTLLNIKESLDSSFTCISPATPYDDTFKDFTSDQRDFICKEMDKFINDANKAINNADDEKEASLLWKEHLGKRFPTGVKSDKSKSSIHLLEKQIGSSTPYAKSDQ